MSSDDTKVRADARAKEVETLFNKLTESEKTLMAERSGIDQKLSTIRTQKLELRGEYNGLKALLQEPVPIEGEVIDSPEKKTKK